MCIKHFIYQNYSWQKLPFSNLKANFPEIYTPDAATVHNLRKNK